jgi:hypothetical protein
MDINIRISADSALVNALSDIAGALAAVSIAKQGKDGHLPPKTTPAPKVEAKAPAKEAPKAEPKTEELKGEPVSPAKTKEINDLMKTGAPDEIIDKSLIKKVRAVVSAYCERIGKDAGHDNVKKWLADKGYGGLSKLTYKGMDEFIAFMENEMKEVA